jgi:hypothetical protein
MLPFDLWLLASSVLPHVRAPWPESIGLGFPFAMSGASSMLGGILHAGASSSKRDRVSSEAGVYGFGLGLAVYVLALVNQLLFPL